MINKINSLPDSVCIGCRFGFGKECLRLRIFSKFAKPAAIGSVLFFSGEVFPVFGYKERRKNQKTNETIFPVTLNSYHYLPTHILDFFDFVEPVDLIL